MQAKFPNKILLHGPTNIDLLQSPNNIIEWYSNGWTFADVVFHCLPHGCLERSICMHEVHRAFLNVTWAGLMTSERSGENSFTRPCFKTSCGYYSTKLAISQLILVRFEFCKKEITPKDIVYKIHEKVTNVFCHVLLVNEGRKWQRTFHFDHAIHSIGLHIWRQAKLKNFIVILKHTGVSHGIHEHWS